MIIIFIHAIMFKKIIKGNKQILLAYIPMITQPVSASVAPAAQKVN